MAFGGRGYLPATRHPWFCVLFVLPLLVLYEAGLNLMQAPQPDLLRNGADSWLRGALAALGLGHLLWAPGLLLFILLLWSLLRSSPGPQDCLSVWIGMALESVVFAVVLYGLSRSLGMVLERWGIHLELAEVWLVGLPASVAPDPVLARIWSFLGAGIYEETLFRLLLFTGLYWIFQQADFPFPGAWVLAALCSSVFFAAAHHLGSHGEAFHSIVFTFRTLAGMYFALLFHWRGFGIAVGAHTGYDVLVGVLIGARD